jgi:hypothetical protein
MCDDVDSARPNGGVQRRAVESGTALDTKSRPKMPPISSRCARPLQRLVRRVRRWWFFLPIIVAMNLCTLMTSQTMRAAAVPG